MVTRQPSTAEGHAQNVLTVGRAIDAKTARTVIVFVITAKVINVTTVCVVMPIAILNVRTVTSWDTKVNANHCLAANLTPRAIAQVRFATPPVIAQTNWDIMKSVTMTPTVPAVSA